MTKKLPPSPDPEEAPRCVKFGDAARAVHCHRSALVTRNMATSLHKLKHWPSSTSAADLMTFKTFQTDTQTSSNRCSGHLPFTSAAAMCAATSATILTVVRTTSAGMPRKDYFIQNCSRAMKLNLRSGSDQLKSAHGKSPGTEPHPGNFKTEIRAANCRRSWWHLEKENGRRAVAEDLKDINKQHEPSANAQVTCAPRKRWSRPTCVW